MGAAQRDWIRMRIAELGWTQKEFAHRAGVNRRTVVRWLNEPGIPRINEQRDIALALDLEFTEVREHFKQEQQASSASTPTIPEITAPQDEASRAFRARIQASSTVDGQLITLLTQQADAIRATDRQLGSRMAHEQLLGYLRSLEHLWKFSIDPNQRDPLGQLYADAASLAGWQSLDLGEFEAAWTWFERSKTAAREVQATASLAHSVAEQAYVLLEVGEVQRACQLVTGAKELKGNVPPLLRAWLAAAEGEMWAAQGDKTRSIRAFDAAELHLPSEERDPLCPYLFLNRHHLERWRGHALARVGDNAAIDDLRTALDAVDHSFVRARAGMHLDLTTALLQAGKAGEAQEALLVGQQLAEQVGSVRQLKRVRRLEGQLLAIK